MIENAGDAPSGTGRDFHEEREFPVLLGPLLRGCVRSGLPEHDEAGMPGVGNVSQPARTTVADGHRSGGRELVEDL
jgi:hypothetical protein